MHLHFSIFWFPSFLEVVSRWNKKKIHYKQFKTPKTKFLGPFPDTTHANKCGFAFQRHSSGDCIFLINLFFLIQTVLFFKPFYQNPVWPLKSIHTDSKWRATMSSFAPQSLVQSWLNCAKVGTPAYQFRMKSGDWLYCTQNRNIRGTKYGFSCTMKERWKKPSMQSTWDLNTLAILWKTIYKMNVLISNRRNTQSVLNQPQPMILPLICGPEFEAVGLFSFPQEDQQNYLERRNDFGRSRNVTCIFW